MEWWFKYEVDEEFFFVRREFRMALDRANVWGRKEYYDSDILDGTQWDLVIKYEDASVHSGGSNNYPPEEEFKLFVTAVRQLLGDKDFLKGF